MYILVYGEIFEIIGFRSENKKIVVVVSARTVWVHK